MLEFHPLANLFPLIEGQAFADLVADVKANGLLDEIVLLDGKILDGRNRYRAAIAAGLFGEDLNPKTDWRFVEFSEQGIDGVFSSEVIARGPLKWVLSKNLHRRHLDESQRSALGARLETLDHGGNRRGGDDQDANLQLTRSTVAEIVNVSPRSIASSKKVLNEGAPELFTAIETGRVKASVAEKLLALPKDKQVEAVTLLEPKKLTTLAKQASRDLVEKRLADKTRELPTEQYAVIYADPAWQFEVYSRETGLDRAADNHYPTQSTEEICKLPVGTISAPDCALFLWATAPMLPDALRVMRFWGFAYKTCFAWDKVTEGTGYWSRNRHELLLVGTKGNIPAPAPGTQWPSVIVAKAGRHSEKPVEGYELIEDYFPNLPKIELNARIQRPGWTAWGLEAPEVAGAMMASGAGEGAAVAPAPSPADPREVFRQLVEASTVAPGSYSRSTAEPILRAAYACEPIVPTKELAAALGHPVGTVLTWASRLELTKPERRGGPDRLGQATGGASE
ncbi:MAG: S-adenosylmethionine-binding protein [Hyphomicrobiales bacterium]|nr:MAG: S-adenosylmethionine-binding protein [Hyphomicrobiales bacterium]